MKTNYAIFDQSGAFTRFEQIDSATLPPVPLADDGKPRAVPTGEAPEIGENQQLAYNRNGWVIVAIEPVVPQSVTRRQLRRWLVKSGVSLDAIRTSLEKLPEPQRSLALIDFNDATTYERNNPLVEMLAAQMGVDADAAFIAAAKE